METEIAFFDPRLDGKRYPLNIPGIAKAFAESEKNNFAFLEDSGKSLCYDGRRWRPDKSKTFVLNGVMDFVLFLKRLADEVEEANQEKKENEKEANPLMTLANSLLSPGTWSSFLTAYQLWNHISRCDLDADGNALDDFGLLNCLNCTIDLNTLKEHNHDPTDRLTKLANVYYNPKAGCPEWDIFIDEITCEDKKLARYIQKAFGYSLTTETLLECLFIFYGPKSRNGKSTLLDTVLTVLGDYRKSMQPSTISAKMGRHGLFRAYLPHIYRRHFS